MAFSTKFGSFNTGTAAATNTVAVTGVGFQPKVVLMWWVGRTDTTDAVGRANTLLGFGAAISTSSRYCTTQYSLDAAATSDGGLLASSTACVQTCDGAGASTGALDHQSMDADGFTLVVDVQFAASVRVHYLALGGTDLTNYKLATMTAPTSTGNLAYTGVGFQPDLVLMFINGINGGIGGSSTRQPIHIGAAKSSSARWTVSAGQDDGSATMDAYSYANDIECVGIINAVGGATPEAQADFVSMDADGFTLNWTRAFGTSARGGWYLALKGGQYALGSVLTQTDTTTDIVVSGLGFSPVGGLVVSHNQAENSINTATANANMSIGGFNSATSRGAVAYMDQNGLADSEVTTAVEHDEVYANVDGGALLGLMDVKSVDAGGVTFIMDDADPAQAFATYLFFGSAGGTTYNQSASGGTTPAGAIIRGAAKVPAGTLTTSATVNKASAKAFSGTQTTSGDLTKTAAKIFTGAVTSAGALINTAGKALSGALTSSGALLNSTGKTLAGTVTSAGEIAKASAKAFTGTLTSAGDLIKSTVKAFTGTLTSDGVLTSIRTFLKDLGGTLTLAGAAIRETAKSLSGTLTTSGAISKAVDKVVSGALTLAGAISKAIGKVVSGVLSFIGALTSEESEGITGVGNLEIIKAARLQTIYADPLENIKAARNATIEAQAIETIKAPRIQNIDR